MSGARAAVVIPVLNECEALPGAVASAWAAGADDVVVVDGGSTDGSPGLVEPPTRLLLAWQISADWAYDAALETTIEVRFEALDAATTQVHLEHRGLEAYGGRAAEMVAIFESAGAWTGMLEAFAGAARS